MQSNIFKIFHLSQLNIIKYFFSNSLNAHILAILFPYDNILSQHNHSIIISIHIIKYSFISIVFVSTLELLILKAFLRPTSIMIASYKATCKGTLPSNSSFIIFRFLVIKVLFLGLLFFFKPSAYQIHPLYTNIQI
jgi:hypothetical protein